MIGREMERRGAPCQKGRRARCHSAAITTRSLVAICLSVVILLLVRFMRAAQFNPNMGMMDCLYIGVVRKVKVVIFRDEGNNSTVSCPPAGPRLPREHDLEVHNFQPGERTEGERDLKAES